MEKKAQPQHRFRFRVRNHHPVAITPKKRQPAQKDSHAAAKIIQNRARQRVDSIRGLAFV